MNQMQPLTLGSILAALTLLWVGCAGPERAELPRGSIANPLWSTQQIDEHVSFLRGAGEGAFQFDANRPRYVADRMHRFGVQPVVSERHQIRRGDELLAVMGYVSGRHPRYSSEAVLVSADLRNPEATSALLEVARLYSDYADQGVLPERTLIFAAWNGGIVGLQAYLRQPTWPAADIKAQVFIDPHPDELSTIHTLAMDQGWRVHFSGRALWQNETSEVEEPDTPTADRAEQLARDAFPRIRAEIVTGGPFLPIRADTLFPPPVDQDDAIQP